MSKVTVVVAGWNSRKELSSVTRKTLRERFFKIAAHVREMKTKIKVEFPASCPQTELLENYLPEIGQRRH